MFGVSRNEDAAPPTSGSMANESWLHPWSSVRTNTKFGLGCASPVAAGSEISRRKCVRRHQQRLTFKSGVRMVRGHASSTSQGPAQRPGGKCTPLVSSRRASRPGPVAGESAAASSVSAGPRPSRASSAPNSALTWHLERRVGVHADHGTAVAAPIRAQPETPCGRPPARLDFRESGQSGQWTRTRRARSPRAVTPPPARISGGHQTPASPESRQGDQPLGVRPPVDRRHRGGLRRVRRRRLRGPFSCLSGRLHRQNREMAFSDGQLAWDLNVPAPRECRELPYYFERRVKSRWNEVLHRRSQAGPAEGTTWLMR